MGRRFAQANNPDPFVVVRVGIGVNHQQEPCVDPRERMVAVLFAFVAVLNDDREWAVEDELCKRKIKLVRSDILLFFIVIPFEAHNAALPLIEFIG